MSQAAEAGPSNLVEVTSPEHFTEIMQQDLNRVSLLNFYAPWAEPCKQMNEVVKEIAVKYPQVLCLVVSIIMHTSNAIKEADGLHFHNIYPSIGITDRSRVAARRFRIVRRRGRTLLRTASRTHAPLAHQRSQRLCPLCSRRHPRRPHKIHRYRQRIQDISHPSSRL